MRTTLRTVIFLFLLATAGCETNLPQDRFPEITFAHLPPIALDVARIDVVSQFEAPFKAPHVEHEVPAPPKQAVEQWIADRLQAAGDSGTAKVYIRDASIIEATLKPIGGIRGAFTTEQSERYVARIEVEIEATGGKGRRLANATAQAKRSRTIAEDATLRQRETLWFELTEQLMQDFNLAFEAQIRQHLAVFLK